MDLETKIYRLTKYCKKNKINAYLVGGCIRDFLLKLPLEDIDICVEHNAKDLACKFAQDEGGTFVALDEKNHIYRVIFKENNRLFYADFSLQRGKNIYDDLGKRDFTVDALAFPLKFPYSGIKKEGIIDIFEGINDLEKKTIRALSKNCFIDDPLRLLRAFRLAATLNFKVDKKTLSLIKKQASLIKTVSGERIRDELFQILECNDSYPVIVLLDKYSLMENIFPQIIKLKNLVQDKVHHLDVWSHSLESLKYLEEIFKEILSMSFPRRRESIPYLPADIKEKLKGHFQEKFSGFSRSSLNKFGIIFHDLGKPATFSKQEGKIRFIGHEEVGVKLGREIFKMLHLSKQQSKIIEKIITGHMRPGNLAGVKNLTSKGIFRYFRDLGKEGIDVLIISLADRYATTGPFAKKEDIRKQEKLVIKMVKIYFSERPVIPPALVNGNELMEKINLTPGPLIGKLLKEIQEAQVEGKISTREEAIEFAIKILNK